MLRTLISRIFEWNDGPFWRGGAGSAVLTIDAGMMVRAVSGEAPALLRRSRAAATGADFRALFAGEDADRIRRGASLGPAAGAVRARLAGEPDFLDLRFERIDAGLTGVLLTAVQSDPAAFRSHPMSSEMLADVSHEMRTPLNAVIGFADAMLAETYGPLGHDKYQEYATIVRASGRHLLDLVTSLLDLAKLEAGRYVVRRETVDLGALARECAAIMRIEAEKAGLKIVVRIADGLPEAALDPRAIRQVIINLLSNAVKFTSDGRIALEVAAEGEELLVSVTDTGVGMSAEEVAKLGKRYAGKGADGVRGATGNGLGLALAFALVECHGGVLALESAPGEGLRAQARLPIVKPARPDRRARAIEEAAPTAPEPPAVLTQLERVEAYRRERARLAA